MGATYSFTGAAGLYGNRFHTLRLEGCEGLFLGFLHACFRECQPLLVLAERLLVPLLVYTRLCASNSVQSLAPQLTQRDAKACEWADTLCRAFGVLQITLPEERGFVPCIEALAHTKAGARSRD